jgi:chaperone required for assembly of F1-ATPase
MSDWKQKRFWTEVGVAQVDGGYAVQLDGRGVKTPAKAALNVPTKALGDAIAAEWDAQVDIVNPNTMPFTRSANAAIDKVRIQHAEVADMLAAYGDADMLCYRATDPIELVDRQSKEWDLVLVWAASELDAPLETRSGIMHVPQAELPLRTLSAKTHALSNFELAAFHDLVSLSGSLILGFAAAYGYAAVDELWTKSRLDELWQEELWGPDDEAQALANIKKEAFLHAKRFFDASQLG